MLCPLCLGHPSSLIPLYGYPCPSCDQGKVKAPPKAKDAPIKGKSKNTD